MLLPQDLQHRASGFGAVLVRLKDASLVASRERLDCLAQPPRKYLPVEGSGSGCVIHFPSASASAVEDFGFRVVDQGHEVSLLPEIHPISQAASDVNGFAHSWGRLQDHCSKHYRAFGVPFVVKNSLEFRRQRCDKSSSYPSLRDAIGSDRKLYDAFPASLPTP